MSNEKITVRPLHDRVLVRRSNEEEKTKGGIYIPDTAKEKPQKGVVMAVGSGRRGDKGDVFPLEVKVNDEVLFSTYSGSAIKIEDREYLMMREEEILGVLN